MTKRLSSSAFEDNDMIDIPGEAEDISDMQREIDSELDKIFSEFGGHPNDVRFKIVVLRIIPNRAEYETCFSCLPAELPITERIINEYGPGEYEIRVYKNGKVFRKPKFIVAKPIDQTARFKGNSSGDLKDVLAVMQENQRIMFEQMQTMMRQNQPAQVPAVDPMQMFQQQLMMMKMMKEVIGTPQAAGGLGNFKEVIELAREFADMGGEKTPSDAFYKLVETAMPALIDGAKNAQQNPPQRMPQQSTPINVPVRPGGAVKAGQTINQNPINQTEENPMFFKMMIERQLAQLVECARMDKDTGLYCDLILDQVPDAFLSKYIDFVRRETAISELGAMNPVVMEFKPWFDQFRQDTLERIAEMEGEENSPLTDAVELSHASEHDTKPPIDGVADSDNLNTTNNS